MDDTPPKKRYNGINDAYAKLFPADSAKMTFQTFKTRPHNHQHITRIKDAVTQDKKDFKVAFKLWQAKYPEKAAALHTSTKKKKRRSSHDHAQKSPRLTDINHLFSTFKSDTTNDINNDIIQLLKSSIAHQQRLRSDVKDLEERLTVFYKELKYIREKTNKIDKGTNDVVDYASRILTIASTATPTDDDIIDDEEDNNEDDQKSIADDNDDEIIDDEDDD